MKKMTSYANLEYVTVYFPTNDVHAKSILKVETKISRFIIKNRPLRGREVQFLRKTSMLSCEKLGSKMGISGTTIFKWEKAPSKRLSPPNEAFVRLFFAELLSISIGTSLKEMIPDKETELELKAS
ncbi:MAG: hypothetical protein E2O68_00270 [Deltaproteobacteria bacterium]|nr:MAG: hypothetical protein E2O68_00270 [Deltaproteobacteria bacterium]